MTQPDAKILVVEDEFQVRTLMLRILDQAGYATLSAGNAEDALIILDREKVSLILLDLRMPGPIDGEDLLFRIRDRGDDVPVIVCSAWVDDEILLDQPDCVYAVLKKPIQFKELCSTVRDALAA